MRAAETRYCPEASEQLAGNAVLLLVREPNNAQDGFATVLSAPGIGRIGYVAKQYSRILAGHLDAGRPLRAVAVRWLAVPNGRRRLIVRVSRS